MSSIGYALARAELMRVLTAYSGITTEDGEVVDGRGTTLVDSNLKGRNDFISEKAVLIMSGDAKNEDKGATAFDNSDGKITLQGTGVSAQIKAGTIYRVLNISSIEIDVANIATKIGRQLFNMDLWSDPQEEVQLTTTAEPKSLPNVVIADLPTGATIVRAIAMFKFRIIENTHADNPNYIEADQYIQVKKSGQSYNNAIKMINTLFNVAKATREGGDVVIGNINLAGANKVDAEATYEFQWTNADANQDNLQFNDVQCGLRVWFSV